MKHLRLGRFIYITFLIILAGACNPKTSKKVSIEVPKSTEFKPAEITSTRKLHGQQVYIPVYSSIYNQYEENLLHMTAILSIRNTSFKEKISIKRVDYYDTNGKLLKEFIKGPFTLGKMSSKDFVIPENDLQGGTGANFIVEWDSENTVSLPLIESVMLGAIGTKGFSFSSRGQEVQAH